MMARINKIKEELRHQISLIVQQELKDPRIGMVTVTKVEVTPDFREAKVYFTTMETNASFDSTVKGLNSSAGFVRKLIGERMRMRFTPQISFIYDDSQTRQDRIEEIIDRIHKEKEQESED